MYIHFNGRTMKFEKTVEMWRKQGVDEHEIKLRKFLVPWLSKMERGVGYVQGAHLQNLGNRHPSEAQMYVHFSGAA